VVLGVEVAVDVTGVDSSATPGEVSLGLVSVDVVILSGRVGEVSEEDVAVEDTVVDSSVTTSGTGVGEPCVTTGDAVEVTVVGSSEDVTVAPSVTVEEVSTAGVSVDVVVLSGMGDTEAAVEDVVIDSPMTVEVSGETSNKGAIVVVVPAGDVSSGCVVGVGDVTNGADATVDVDVVVSEPLGGPAPGNPVTVKGLSGNSSIN